MEDLSSPNSTFFENQFTPISLHTFRYILRLTAYATLELASFRKDRLKEKRNSDAGYSVERAPPPPE